MENNKQNKYKEIEKLGEGTYWTTYKVSNEDNNNIYALKKIHLKEINDEELLTIKNEVVSLSKIKSDNLVNYYDSFEDNESFNIIMEYFNGLELKKFINEHKNSNSPIEKTFIYLIIGEICNGLKEIHKNNVIHRNLKPSNIFVTSKLKVKIGDFCIAKQLNNSNINAKEQVGTTRYMAREVIMGENYNYKVDMWSLGCIIHELCTLNFCFDALSNDELINNIKNCKYTRINKDKYGPELQELIDSLLDKDYTKRPNIDEILKKTNVYFNRFFFEKIIMADPVFENFIIEQNVQENIEKINQLVFERELKFIRLKYWFTPLCWYKSVIGGVKLAYNYLFDKSGIRNTLIDYFLLPNESMRSIYFIENNLNLLKIIQDNLITQIRTKLKPLKNTNNKIIIYTKTNFDDKILKIKNKIIERNNLKALQKIFLNNFNILLLGCTSAGKSTLINEFLKLDDNKKAKESEGGTTTTIEFAPYQGINNNKTYTLYDTNGITNEGENSIENKKENIIKEIDKRIKTQKTNELIHCIWYCLQGSKIEKSDANFLKCLLNVYTTYTVPIIIVHTYTLSKNQSETCKKGLEKYLNEIYNNDTSKFQQLLDNYINVLARDDGDKKAFGLEELEKLSQKEIETKGIKSSFCEYIKQGILPILINGVFKLIFTQFNIEMLKENSIQNLEMYIKTILEIVNNDNLGLQQEVKNDNKNSIIKIYEYFIKNRENIKKDLLDLLSMKNLKKNFEDNVNEIYEKKSMEYKNENDKNTYSKQVENLIYDNLAHNKDEIINNLLNLEFNNFIIQIIKDGIKEQFKGEEEIILNEIYNEIFKELNKNSN